jgi:hypothetical protein
MQSLVSKDTCADVITCPDGNCEGCLNGVRWCSDVRCAPNCTDCFDPDNNDRYVTGVLIVIMIALLFILFMFVVTSGHSVTQKYSRINISPPK